MGTKYMLLGITLLLAGILFSISTEPVIYAAVAGGVLLAVIGLFKEG